MWSPWIAEAGAAWWRPAGGAGCSPRSSQTPTSPRAAPARRSRPGCGTWGYRAQLSAHLKIEETVQFLYTMENSINILWDKHVTCLEAATSLGCWLFMYITHVGANLLHCNCHFVTPYFFQFAPNLLVSSLFLHLSGNHVKMGCQVGRREDGRESTKTSGQWFISTLTMLLC